MTSSLVLTQAEQAVDTLIKVLGARGYTVIAPTMRDGAILLEQVQEVADLPIGWTDEQEAASYRVKAHDGRSLFAYAVGPRSPRRFLSTPRRTLWSGRRTADGFAIDVASPDSPRYAFIGVKACELAAVAVHDRVLRDGPHPDPAYVRARDQAFFVGVSCGNPASTCFCTSMGTGPAVEAGHDLAATEMLDGARHELLVEVGTERGADVLEEVQLTASWRVPVAEDFAAARTIVSRSVEKMTRRMDPVAAPRRAGRESRPPAMGRRRGAMLVVHELHTRLPHLLLQRNGGRHLARW